MADSLKGLDKLILEVLQESNIVQEDDKPEKGGIEGDKQGEKTTSNLGLDLGEIVSILSVGTESKKVLKSSEAAINTLKNTFGFKPDFGSAATFAQSFSFFDLKSESVMREKCSSFGALLSKYALSAGLISILDKFNGQAAGFVNEAYIAQILGGSTVAVGDGGIEDITIGEEGEPKIGISLKTKKVATLGGSLGYLMETLGVSYYKSGRARTSRSSTVTQRGEGKIFVNSAEPSISMLYYLSFVKGTGGSLKISVYKITKDDLDLSKAETITDDMGVVYYDINGVNDILSMATPVTKESHSYDLSGDYTVDGFNSALKENAAEVFESLKALDAWYGELKKGLITYVSTLEKGTFEDLQSHLKLGSQFTFKAFDLDSCE
tara:strand:- start:1312 stop:2448 length:1137 start_codon:yes stop_codon:yes gene_type:complete